MAGDLRDKWNGNKPKDSKPQEQEGEESKEAIIADIVAMLVEDEEDE